MKVTLFATVAMTAVIGLAFADEMFNNWNNNNDNGFGGISVGGFGAGSIGGGIGHISGGAGYSSGYGSSYGSGYGSSYGSGYGAGYGSGQGASFGYGSGLGAKAAYVPVPAMPKTAGSGLGSFLPLLLLLVFLPLFFNQSGSQDQIILLNSTLEG